MLSPPPLPPPPRLLLLPSRLSSCDLYALLAGDEEGAQPIVVNSKQPGGAACLPRCLAARQCARGHTACLARQCARGHTRGWFMSRMSDL